MELETMVTGQPQSRICVCEQHSSDEVLHVPSDEDDVDKICSLLASLAKISPDIDPLSSEKEKADKECRETLLELERMEERRSIGTRKSNLVATEHALAVLMQHTKEDAVIHAAFCVLRCMISRDETLRARMLALKGPQLILRGMIGTRTSRVAQLAGCSLLLDLTPCRASRETMGQFFAIEVVLSAMKVYHEDMNIVTTACAFLANICFESTKNKDLIVKNGGIKTLLRAMKRWRNSESVQTWSALALGNLSGASVSNQRLISEASGVKVLLMTILTSKDSEKLVLYSHSVLDYIVCGPETHHLESASQFESFRGVEVAVRSMRTFRDCAALHHHTVRLLTAVARHDSSSANVVLNGGGLEAVLSSMIFHRARESIQMSGICLIHGLALLGDDTKRRIINAGGLSTISMSLKTHISNDELAEEGVKALHALKALSRSRLG